jgi:hypothetical protein
MNNPDGARATRRPRGRARLTKWLLALGALAVVIFIAVRQGQMRDEAVGPGTVSGRVITVQDKPVTGGVRFVPASGRAVVVKAKNGAYQTRLTQGHYIVQPLTGVICAGAGPSELNVSPGATMRFDILIATSEAECQARAAPRNGEPHNP